MLLIEYFGHIGLRSRTDGHLGRHLEYFKTLNDARVALFGFIKYNASTTRINKEKNFKIKFQVILVFYWTIVFGVIFKATNSSFQRSITFCRSIYVKKVMKLLAFIFEQSTYLEIIYCTISFYYLYL